MIEAPQFSRPNNARELSGIVAMGVPSLLLSTVEGGCPEADFFPNRLGDRVPIAVTSYTGWIDKFDTKQAVGCSISDAPWTNDRLVVELSVNRACVCPSSDQVTYSTLLRRLGD